MLQLFSEELLKIPVQLPPPHRAGFSREGRPLPAYCFGAGSFRISLLAGCHADEPTGPLLARKVVTFLSRLPAAHPCLKDYSWWIVPHANPDGEAVNQRWYEHSDRVYNLASYLRFVDRSAPADDLEFGFPLAGSSGAKHPENAFIFDFWRSAGAPFDLHLSLHSMAFAFGAWFLIDPGWQHRSTHLMDHCRQAAQSLGYPLFDVDRQGEKGFFRLAPGFATRPNHLAMQAFFQEKGDDLQASFFHPSSMESIRSFGGDCLTLVSELPLFVISRKETDLSWPNSEFEQWKMKLEKWKAELLLGKLADDEVNEQARAAGLTPMPVADQMRLQWELAVAGVETVKRNT